MEESILTIHFKIFLSQIDVVYQTLCSCVKKQNEIAKRKHKHLTKMTITLLSYASLQNICMCLLSSFKTLYNSYTSTKIKLTFLD